MNYSRSQNSDKKWQGYFYLIKLQVTTYYLKKTKKNRKLNQCQNI